MKTMPNVKDAQDTQVLDARSTVPEEETLDLVQVVLNPQVQAVLPDTMFNPDTKGMSFGNCFLKPPSDVFILSPFFFQTCKEVFKN
jgi:hypothetical protein